MHAFGSNLRCCGRIHSSCLRQFAMILYFSSLPTTSCHEFPRFFIFCYHLWWIKILIMLLATTSGWVSKVLCIPRRSVHVGHFGGGDYRIHCDGQLEFLTHRNRRRRTTSCVEWKTTNGSGECRGACRRGAITSETGALARLSRWLRRRIQSIACSQRTEHLFTNPTRDRHCGSRYDDNQTAFQHDLV